MTSLHVVKPAAAALLLAAAIPTGPVAQVEQQQSAGGGQAKALQCVVCHGPGGISQNPMFPHLAGQQAKYLQLQLDNFKNGERYNPLMTPIAQSLSDQDITELANYFSSIGPLASATAQAESQP